MEFNPYKLTHKKIDPYRNHKTHIVYLWCSDFFVCRHYPDSNFEIILVSLKTRNPFLLETDKNESKRKGFTFVDLVEGRKSVVVAKVLPNYKEKRPSI
ncbi:hypothetical protein A0128_10230 [Leptospira tipperaryensis]|uniref:Uncharacterized protein n=1 Tax=Leptospira tipperaryensis TaxID=2564040 RepID=A0A1D7UX76_9LEPT|nr:hypothetical protein A0128_10230 [Leptospira tipperaryensis]